LNEAGSKEAKASVAQALKKGDTLHTADLALIEGLNAIWKHANIFKEIKTDEALLAMEDLIKFYDRLNIISARESAMEAAQIAIAQNIAVYDALFIAAALKVNGTLFTADGRLCAIAQKVTNSKLLVSKDG
jgi:predicted nucleic acid-binding protein